MTRFLSSSRTSVCLLMISSFAQFLEAQASGTDISSAIGITVGQSFAINGLRNRDLQAVRIEGALYLIVIFWPLIATEVFAGRLRGGGCAGLEPPGGSSATDTPPIGPST